MNCPNCSAEMLSMTLDGQVGVPVTIDVCADCQAFWFDKYENLKLSPASTLKLIKFTGEHAARAGLTFGNALRCPRCSGPLRNVNDMQRNVRFRYWRCDAEHGRFIRFLEFLREKNFLRPLSPTQIAELRRNLQTVNCSNCGAPIDLAKASTCTHCGSGLSMLDMNQPQQLLDQLQKAAQPKAVDPALPLELARAKREMDSLFAGLDSGRDWWTEASSAGLVQAGLSTLARWLTKSGI